MCAFRVNVYSPQTAPWALCDGDDVVVDHDDIVTTTTTTATVTACHLLFSSKYSSKHSLALTHLIQPMN